MFCAQQRPDFRDPRLRAAYVKALRKMLRRMRSDGVHMLMLQRSVDGCVTDFEKFVYDVVSASDADAVPSVVVL